MITLKRDLEESIRDYLSNNRAMFILGARQVGKTTLLKRIMDAVGASDCIYLDLENPVHLRGLSRPVDEVVSFIDSLTPNNDHRKYVLIDEIQYIQDFSRRIKYLVDHYSDKFKLIMTGSSTLLIKQSFTESLVGRKDILELYPLSFEEFCLFKGEERIKETLSGDKPNAVDKLYVLHEKLNRLLAEYMLYGGYPKVVLTEKRKEKVDILRDIVSSYILKDVKHLFKIENIDQFNHLIRYLAINTGKELNIRSIATEIGMHWVTVQKHILALQESYVINKITPYHKNQTTELRKMPKVYFVDAGVRNVLLNNFNELEYRTDRGEMFENYVFNQLFLNRSFLSEIKYWKTRNHNEVDFVVIDQGRLTAYEVKYGTESKNFLAFLNGYPEATCRTVRFNYKKKAGELPGWAI